MNDTETLNWVAEHLSSFSPSIDSAYMRYVNDDGYEKDITIINDGTCLEQLKACIEKAIK